LRLPQAGGVDQRLPRLPKWDDFAFLLAFSMAQPIDQGQRQQQDEYPGDPTNGLSLLAKLAAGYDLVTAAAQGFQILNWRVSRGVVSAVAQVVGLKRIAGSAPAAAALATISIAGEGLLTGTLPLVTSEVAIVVPPPALLFG
jgi:hypothetical protein